MSPFHHLSALSCKVRRAFAWLDNANDMATDFLMGHLSRLARRWGLLAVVILLIGGGGLVAGNRSILEQATFFNGATGSAERTAKEKLKDIVSAVDFGADPTGANDSRSAIQAAITALSSGGTLLLPKGTYKIDTTTPITMSNSGINIVGSGIDNTVLSVIGTGDLFQISSTFFKLKQLTLKVNTSSSRASVALLSIATGSAQGHVEDVRLVANSSSPSNGIAFKEEVTGSGAWIYDRIHIDTSSGATWKSIWRLYSSSGTNSSHMISNVEGSAFTVTDAAIDIDSVIDTVAIQNWLVVPLGRAMWIRNTAGVSVGSYPRWIHAVNFFSETGGTASGVADVQIDSGRDIRFTNSYFGTSEKGIVVNANATEIDISHSVFVNIGKIAIDVQNTTVSNVRIQGNSFLDCGATTNNTYDTIAISAGVTDFEILNNTFNDTLANKSRYHIALGAGAGDRFNIIGNKFLTAGVTANIGNFATGVVRTILGNLGTTNVLGDVTTIDKGVTGDGQGFKHKRSVAGCTTAASVGATCTTTFSWGTAFADANYTVTCFGAGINSGVPLVQAYTAKAAASTTVQTVAMTAAAAQFANLECQAVHD